MKINILQKGDKVIGITQQFVAVKRKGGEVDVIPLVFDGSGYRIDYENILTIGYGSNSVETENEDGTVVIRF